MTEKEKAPVRLDKDVADAIRAAIASTGGPVSGRSFRSAVQYLLRVGLDTMKGGGLMLDLPPVPPAMAAEYERAKAEAVPQPTAPPPTPEPAPAPPPVESQIPEAEVSAATFATLVAEYWGRSVYGGSIDVQLAWVQNRVEELQRFKLDDRQARTLRDRVRAEALKNRGIDADRGR